MLKLKQLWLQGVQTLLTFILNALIFPLKLFIKLLEAITSISSWYVAYVVIVLLSILSLVGWVANLGKVLFAIPPHLQDVTTLYALRVIGIPAVPLGAALGFF
jgi:hypothetical protein